MSIERRAVMVFGIEIDYDTFTKLCRENRPAHMDQEAYDEFVWDNEYVICTSYYDDYPDFLIGIQLPDSLPLNCLENLGSYFMKAWESVFSKTKFEYIMDKYPATIRCEMVEW